MQNLHSLEFLQNLYGGTAPGPPNIENGAHGTKKLLLKTQVSENVA
jgi:hypothetical protein